MHGGVGCIQYENNTNMLMIGLHCTTIIYTTNLWTYLLHKHRCNKVTYIPNCYNEKNVMYIPHLVKVMYIKKNTLSLAHLLIHISDSFLWKKSHCAHLLAPNIWIKKCYEYKQSHQCCVCKKRILSPPCNFELSLGVASNMKITRTC